eukprot:m.8949 g.8949  ORF g.8949 m.8949 type:complete len:392 (-) comp3981_c0_seq1:43-1218(-)
MHNTRIVNHESTDEKTGSNNYSVVRFTSATVIGLCFGFLLNRAKCDVPVVIVEQMKFHHHTMLRMFLGAAASSTLCLTVLRAFGILNTEKRGGLSLGLSTGSPTFDRYSANITGGAILGLGMTVSGSCPGTVWSQIGASIPNSWYVLAGCATGVGMFAYGEPYVRRMLPKFQERASPSYVHEFLGLSPFQVSAVLVTVELAVITGVNILYPWRESSKLWITTAGTLASTPSAVFATSWDPLLCGALLGLLQVPCTLASSGYGLGNSSGWMTMVGTFCSVCDKDCDTRAPAFRFGSSFQACSAFGIMFGAWLSMNTASHALHGQEVLSQISIQDTPSPMLAFLGGICIIIGSRLGDGCTAGHGLTGMATLSTEAFFSVASMFAGGMSAALFM